MVELRLVASGQTSGKQSLTNRWQGETHHMRATTGSSHAALLSVCHARVSREQVLRLTERQANEEGASLSRFVSELCLSGSGFCLVSDSSARAVP